MIKLAILASGGGTNLQAILDACASGRINARVCAVLSDKGQCGALERAARHGVPAIGLSKKAYASEADFNAALLAALQNAAPDYIILAGYLSILPENVVNAYAGQMLNIHPSLIPKFCGMGFYGLKVHEAVLKSGDAETGATVHVVEAGVDTGPVIAQRSVPVLPGDDAATLQKRVLEAEHTLLVEAINKYCIKT